MCTVLNVLTVLSLSLKSLSKICLPMADSATEHNFTCLLWKGKNLVFLLSPLFWKPWYIKVWKNQFYFLLLIQAIKMTKQSKQMHSSRNTELLKYILFKSSQNSILSIYCTSLLSIVLLNFIRSEETDNILLFLVSHRSQTDAFCVEETHTGLSQYETSQKLTKHKQISNPQCMSSHSLFQIKIPTDVKRTRTAP